MNKISSPTYPNSNAPGWGMNSAFGPTANTRSQAIGPWASYGYGSSPEIESYIRSMHQYQQMLLSRRTQTRDPQLLAQIDQYLAMSNQYLMQVGDSGGMGNLYGEGFGSNGFSGLSSGGVSATGGIPDLGPGSGLNANLRSSFMDSQKVLYEDAVSNFTADRGAAQSEVHFYDYGEMTFAVPGSAHAKFIEENGVIVAVVTWPGNGVTDGMTKKYFFHNNKKVTAAASDADRQVDITDASLKPGKVVKGSEELQKSDPIPGAEPKTRKDGKLGWDGDSFEIYSRSDGKDKYVSARSAVNFHAFSNTEYWTVEWDGVRYAVKVYDDPKDRTAAHLKETFFVDDMTNLKASFDIDPTHIIFLGRLGKGGKDSNEINTTDDYGKKLSFAQGAATGPGAGDPINPQHPKETGESVPHSTNKGIAVYDQDPNVKLHIDFDRTGGVSTSRITAQTVELWPFTQADAWNVEIIQGGPDDGKYKLTLTGNDSSGQAQTQTFLIDPMVTNVRLHSDRSKITGSAANDPKIQGEGVSNVDYPEGLKDLLTGKKDSEILAALQKAGYTEYKTIADLVKATQDKNFPPKDPDSQMIKFLSNLGLTMDKWYDALQKMYPDHKFSNYQYGSPIEFMFDDQLVAIDVIKKEVTLTDGYPWPAGRLANFIPNGDNDERARKLAIKMDSAVQSGNWDEVLNYLNSENSWDVGGAHAGDQNLNDMIRKVMTALFSVSEATDDKDPRFIKLLKKIPENVRRSLIDWVTHCTGELGERHGTSERHGRSERWNSQDTAGVILSSF